MRWDFPSLQGYIVVSLLNIDREWEKITLEGWK